MAATQSGAFQHEIDDLHARTLRALMKIGEDRPIPDGLQRIYWKFRNLADRLSYWISDGDLIRFVLEAKLEPGVSRPYSFLDVVRENPDVKRDSPVEAKWRGGEWVRGAFHGFRGPDVMVVLEDGTAELRLFHPADVRLPEEVKVIV